MKRFFALSLILISFATLLCACDSSFAQKSPIQGDNFNKPTVSPYQSQKLDTVVAPTFTVYICGAVQNEGYYGVTQGTTIGDAIALAGILPQTFLPQNSQTYIQNDCQIVVDYCQGDAHYSAINVNGLYVANNLPTPNISADVIEKLHNYYANNGAITNKQIIKQILTDEQYQQNYYKLYVSEDDYATAD